MPWPDDDLLARAAWWCAASGRPAAEEELRAALEPLSWDQLLAVKAVLADPPPPGFEGAAGLLRLARAGPAPVRPAADAAPSPSPPAAPGGGALPLPAPPPPPRAAGRAPRASGPRIRRVRDRSPGVEEAPASLPRLDELFREEGRAVLERALRRRGASRPLLAAALSAGWRRGDGSVPGPEDVDRLLEHHGLARAFQERERALFLHTLRRHAGVRPLAAAALGYDVPGLDAAVLRLGLEGPVEALRAQARRDLLRRATLAERARLVTARGEALADLDVLEEMDEDLRRRLPEHVRALRAGGSSLPLGLALARSLSIGQDDAEALAARLGVPLDGPAGAARGDRAPRPAAGGGRGARARVGRGGTTGRGGDRSGARRGQPGERRDRRSGGPRSGPSGGRGGPARDRARPAGRSRPRGAPTTGGRPPRPRRP